MQKIEVELSIEIPSEYVVIKKVEYEELKKLELYGVYWNMKDLEKRTGRKIEWLKENVLYPPHLRKKLDVQQGGFVYYPAGKGQAWSFHAVRMVDFLDKNFSMIFKNK